MRFEQLNMAWVHYLPAATGHKVESLDDIWPLRIPGTWIGSTEGLKALSVQDWFGQLVVWAFSERGQAMSWHVDDGQRPAVRMQKVVGFDGIVRDNCESPDLDIAPSLE